MKSSTTDGRSGVSIAAPKSSGIARDEWLKALAEAGIEDVQSDDGSITVEDFAEMFSLARSTSARRLEALVAAGKAKETTKRIRSATRWTWCRAYRLV